MNDSALREITTRNDIARDIIGLCDRRMQGHWVHDVTY
jgi:hypothetical protein